MNYIVVIEGQEIPVPEEIGRDDEAVKRALAPYFPDAANAMITRVEEGETVKVTVVKRAGSKGLEPLQYLLECQGGKNPAIALYEELQGQKPGEMDPEQLLELGARLEAAIEAGREQGAQVDYALKRLAEAAPRPAPEVVQGF